MFRDGPEKLYHSCTTGILYDLYHMQSKREAEVISNIIQSRLNVVNFSCIVKEKLTKVSCLRSSH